MARTIEYLERRLIITEAVLLDLGDLLAAHLPAMTRELSRLGKGWDDELGKLNKEVPDTPDSV